MFRTIFENIKIDWRKSTDFPPISIITLNRFPNRECFIFEQKSDLFRAEYLGIVCAYKKDDKGEDLNVEILLEDKTKKIIKKGSYPNSYVLNEFFQAPCVETIYELNNKKFFGYISVSTLKQLLDFFILEVRLSNRSPIKALDKNQNVYNLMLKHNHCSNIFHELCEEPNKKCPVCKHFNWK